MKKIPLFLVILLSEIVFSQVGINTETPQADLHVDGSLQLTSEFNLGGDGSISGDPGEAGDFLKSRGPGLPPEWVTSDESFIAQTATVGIKDNISPTSGSYAGGSTNTIVFNSIPKIDINSVTYDVANGTFTIVKSGYYQVVTYLTYDLNANPDGQTSGTAISGILNISTGNAIARNTTNHTERTGNVYHNLVGTAFLVAGNQFRITGAHTRQYKLTGASISVTYVSE